MEPALAVLALILAAAAIALVADLRGRIRRFSDELNLVRQDLEGTHRELAELKAATEIVPAPPLPKARSGGLDDLRQQLRAAHREEDESEE